MQTMDSTQIFLLISIIANVLVGTIFIAQINKQKDIINSMKTFMNIFDINKVEGYVKLMEKKKEM